MTWQEYFDLHAYWNKHPPTHIIAAAFAVYKPPREIDRNANQDFAIEELMAHFGVKIVPKEELIDVG